MLKTIPSKFGGLVIDYSRKDCYFRVKRGIFYSQRRLCQEGIESRPGKFADIEEIKLEARRRLNKIPEM